MFGRRVAFSTTLAIALAGCASTQAAAPQTAISDFAADCEPWDDWEKPAPAFNIHGDTHYVGTCGIAAILIASDDGHILIDSGTEAGVEIVLANITSLGFTLEDVDILLQSHEHFDHVGGHAAIIARTGAAVIASPEAKRALETGQVDESDPQRAIHPIMQSVEVALDLPPSEPISKGGLEIYAVSTPGHSPGAMSYQWQSCDDGDCITIVYADSMSPVSSENYSFSDNPEYVSKYRQGIARLWNLTACDMLLTPHPSASKMVERAASGSLVGEVSCRDYADSIKQRLDKRLAEEAASR